MKKNIRFAVLGCGRIGSVHAANIVNMQGLELGYVYDPVTAAAKKLSGTLGARIAEDLDEIFSDPQIDAIIICTPTPTHTMLIKKAVLAGKNILCEKPLAPSLKESLACMNFVKKNKGLLMVGFNRPFDPGFFALRKRLTKGAVGRVEHVQITSRDPGAPPISYIKTSGGIFKDMTIHDFEMALRLMPAKPKAIAVMASSIVDPAIGRAGDNDSALISISAADGSTCGIHNSRRAAYGYDQRIEVFGSKGMLQAGNYHEDNLQYANSKGYTKAPLQHFFLERYTDSYRKIVDTFVRAMQGNSEALAELNFTNGINAIYLAEQAGKAAKTGRVIPLKLPY